MNKYKYRYELVEDTSGLWLIIDAQERKIVFESDDQQECLNYLVELEANDYELQEEGDL